jgi:hypothetical protein
MSTDPYWYKDAIIYEIHPTYRHPITEGLRQTPDIPGKPIGELPYFLTLAPYGFYWFLLK